MHRVKAPKQAQPGSRGLLRTFGLTVPGGGGGDGVGVGVGAGAGIGVVVLCSYSTSASRARPEVTSGQRARNMTSRYRAAR